MQMQKMKIMISFHRKQEIRPFHRIITTDIPRPARGEPVTGLTDAQKGYGVQSIMCRKKGMYDEFFG